MNRYAITTMNYFTAFTISLAISLKEKLFSIEPMVAVDTFLSEFDAVVLENSRIFSEASSFLWAMIVGIIAGVFFFLGFIYYQKSVKENGASLSGMFGKLGILVPMIFSIILWREFPTFIQWIGIILAIASIVLVNISFKKKLWRHFKITLILLFLFMGLAEFSNKFFQKYAINEYKTIFLFCVFFIAFIISFIATKRRSKSVRKRDIVVGFAVGVPNLFSSFFLIMALDYVKTSVAFPLFSAAGIVLITIGGAILFKETLKRKDVFAIIMTIIALVLINV
jgi:drug/metabolite transporter (DMT)-like permease